MNPSNIVDLQHQGYTILRNVVQEPWLTNLSNATDLAFREHKLIQEKHNNEIQTEGVALHVLLSNDVFIKFLDYLINSGIKSDLEKIYFNNKRCILNSMSALDNLAKPNFSSIIHRDLRFYSGRFNIMINLLVMLDDFTTENGGTYILPYSHLKENKPDDEEFHLLKTQITGKKGDILIFNSNIWHAAAPNKTIGHRRAIPITISRSFMKPLLDYPRAIGYDKMNMFNPDLQQFLGYYSRVPASLDEWYQPENKRFYKKHQD